MKYKLINENKGKSPLEVIFENRGIDREFVEKLLNADEKYLQDPFKIKNMDRAVEMFKSYKRNKESKFGILIDEDARQMDIQAVHYYI